MYSHTYINIISPNRKRKQQRELWRFFEEPNRDSRSQPRWIDIQVASVTSLPARLAYSRFRRNCRMVNKNGETLVIGFCAINATLWNAEYGTGQAQSMNGTMAPVLHGLFARHCRSFHTFTIYVQLARDTNSLLYYTTFCTLSTGMLQILFKKWT